jgi:hypothetical protein
MSEKSSLDEINESLKQIADIMKPKPKKVNKVAIIGWLLLGVLAFYMLDMVYKLAE